MRGVPLLGLLLALPGCLGATPAPPAELPDGFIVTQPAAAGVHLDVPFPFNLSAPARLNATLVWGTAGNRLDLELVAGGGRTAVAPVAGTVARLERDLEPGDYRLRVTGHPAAADTWRLEVHFTRP